MQIGQRHLSRRHEPEIVFLIVIVAAFNIVSTLTMVVVNKTREIGILRAMGLSARSVHRVFMLQGFVIGVVGTALGAVLGVLIAHFVDERRLIGLDPSVYFVDHLPVQVTSLDVVLIVLAAIIVATVATILPAKRAAMLNPVDAIRYE
jgi:lipoprotein-releasing system permease protein